MTSETLRAPYDVPAVREVLRDAGSLWRRVDVVDHTGSTNADLVARAAAGEDIDGVVLLAENQTAGRGRRGRSWAAISGAQILMSVGLAPGTVPSRAWGLVPLAAGVAVVDAASQCGLRDVGAKIGLKWPNDVLAGAPGSRGKLAGILAEVTPSASAIVVGIGLNVSLQEGEIPASSNATSMLALGVASPDRNALVQSLLRELARRVSHWREVGGIDEDLLATYRTHSLTIGSRVRAMMPGGSDVVGTATAIDTDGRLLIETGSDVVAISAGDIVHLREADVPSAD